MQMQSFHCVVNMRMRKVKWAVEYLNEAKCLIQDPCSFKGHYKSKFPNSKLHVEIGCGKGGYSLEMAVKYPEDVFIAIEKNESAAGMAAKKFDEQKDVSNLFLIQADAIQISDWFDEGEIDVIHLNFSDPWPKNRNAKRRLSSENFISQYCKILNSNGEIQMKTDNSKLFEFSLLEFQKYPFYMDDISVDFRREEHGEDAITEYEQKFIDLGQPIYRCVWKRKDA